MKEVTYKDWQKNPISRMMWVWDYEINTKEKKKVVYIIGKNASFPVITVDQFDNVIFFKHCAEIEKTRRMTNKELSRWLREKPTREYKYKEVDDYIYSYYEYKECHADKEIDGRFLIREDDGEWREPLVEVEE